MKILSRPGSQSPPADSDALQRVRLYFRLLGVSDDQAEQRARQIIGALRQQHAHDDPSLCAQAIQQAMADAQRDGLIERHELRPVVPQPQRGAMQAQRLGKPPSMLRSGFWRRLWRRPFHRART